MLTNRINVTFNLENIDTDFDIYKVEKANKDYYKYNPESVKFIFQRPLKRS